MAALPMLRHPSAHPSSRSEISTHSLAKLAEPLPEPAMVTLLQQLVRGQQRILDRMDEFLDQLDDLKSYSGRRALGPAPASCSPDEAVYPTPLDVHRGGVAFSPRPPAKSPAVAPVQPPSPVSNSVVKFSMGNGPGQVAPMAPPLAMSPHPSSETAAQSSEAGGEPSRPPSSPTHALRSSSSSAAALIPGQPGSRHPHPHQKPGGLGTPGVEETPHGVGGYLKQQWDQVRYSDSPGRAVLHVLLCILACLEFMIVTITWVNDDDGSGGAQGFLLATFILSTLLLFLEMMLNMNTAIHVNKWDIVDDVNISRVAYLRGWFCWDLFVTIPWDLFALAIQRGSVSTDISVGDGATGFSVLVLLRLLHTVRVPTYFGRRNPILDPPRWVSAVYGIIVSVLITHVLAVIWMLVAKPDEQKVGADYGADSTFAYMYIQALNWAFQNFVHGKSDTYGHRFITVWYGFMVKVGGFLVITVMEAKLAEFFVNHDPFHGLARQRQQQLASLITHNRVPWEVQKNIMSIY
eukprot:RCo013805